MREVQTLHNFFEIKGLFFLPEYTQYFFKKIVIHTHAQMYTHKTIFFEFYSIKYSAGFFHRMNVSIVDILMHFVKHKYT